MRTAHVKMLIIAIAAACLFAPTSTHGAEAIRIGVVDFQRILETSEAGKAAQEEIKAEGEKMQKALKERGDEIQELRERLEREALVMDRGMREEKDRELRIKVNDFKALEKKYQDEFQVLNTRLVSRLQKEVFRLVEKLGKAEGYSLILEKREAGVMYHPEDADLTDRIIPMIPKTAVK